MQNEQTSNLKPLDEKDGDKLSPSFQSKPSMQLAQTLWGVYDAWHRQEDDSAAVLISASHHIEAYGKAVNLEVLNISAELLEALEYNHAFLLALHTIEFDKNKREAIADLMDKNSAAIAKAKAGAA